jgi:23S rRNA pseudouridine1911/1915/1917 synthase
VNGGHSYREQVGPAAAGAAVLDHLVARYAHSTRAEWLDRLALGLVELDGRRANGEERLRPGQALVWHRPPWQEPEAPAGPAVLHEDADILVADKPAGLPTVPGGGYLENTLLRRIQARDPAWAPMHRLGRWTSGLVLFARGVARERLQAAWRNHAVEKRYLGWATGTVEAPRAILAPIGPVPHALLGTVEGAVPRGRPSETHLERAGPRGTDSLVTIRIVTGRAHQIRIHLAFAGHPLVGDPLYGKGGVPVGPALPGDPGYLLHAWQLAFAHPGSGQTVRFTAEPPTALANR